jgi:signal transduction histidine kinase
MQLHVPTDAAGSLLAAHRRFRRIRWYCLLGALILYATVESTTSLLLEQLEVFVHDHLVDWSVLVLIGVVFTLAMRRWENRWIAQIAVLERQQRTAEQALTQLNVAQSTLRTIAQNINLLLITIRGTAELHRAVPPTERNDADLDVILLTVDRLTDQVRQLLEVSRSGAADEMPPDDEARYHA